MADPTNFRAIVSEWKLVIDALENYKADLDATVESMEDEDKQNLIYDDLERLDALIPDFKDQFDKAYK